MTISSNKKVAIQFFDAIGGGDATVLSELLEESCVFNIPSTCCLGGEYLIQDFFKLAGKLAPACPDGALLNVTSMTAEGDRVACQVEGKAKTADGNNYNNQYHTLLKIRNGKIYEIWEYMDSLLVEQVFSPYV